MSLSLFLGKKPRREACVPIIYLTKSFLENQLSKYQNVKLFFHITVLFYILYHNEVNLEKCQQILKTIIGIFIRFPIVPLTSLLTLS